MPRAFTAYGLPAATAVGSTSRRQSSRPARCSAPHRQAPSTPWPASTCGGWNTARADTRLVPFGVAPGAADIARHRLQARIPSDMVQAAVRLPEALPNDTNGMLDSQRCTSNSSTRGG